MGRGRGTARGRGGGCGGRGTKPAGAARAAGAASEGSDGTSTSDEGSDAGGNGAPPAVVVSRSGRSVKSSVRLADEYEDIPDSRKRRPAVSTEDGTRRAYKAARSSTGSEAKAGAHTRRAQRGWITRKRNLGERTAERERTTAKEGNGGNGGGNDSGNEDEAVKTHLARGAERSGADAGASERAGVPVKSQGVTGAPTAVGAVSWELALTLEAEEDLTVETAFLLCFTRTRKGGFRSLSALERNMIESFKVIIWSYVAPCALLSMRALKVEAKVDEIAAAEQGTAEGQLAGINLKDGLVVQGYDFLVHHLSGGGGDGDGNIPPLEVHYDTRVARIEHDATGATLLFGDGTSMRADMVLTTVPLGVLKRSAAEGGIDFSPPLSPRKRAAIDHLGMGTENKVALRWAASDTFWPLDAPYLQCTDPRFRFLNGAYFGKPGVLVALVGPPYAEEMETQSDDEVLAVLLPLLHTTFAPSAKALPPPLEVRITRWGHDPFSYGSYSYDRFDSTLGHRIDLRAAEGVPGATLPRLFFAGEACSSDAPQCVHGAVETGREAAAEMLRVLTLSECADEPAVCDGLAAEETEEWMSVCKCRSVWDPLREMTSCRCCRRIFHVECIGVLGPDAPFVCPRCARS